MNSKMTTPMGQMVCMVGPERLCPNPTAKTFPVVYPGAVRVGDFVRASDVDAPALQATYIITEAQTVRMVIRGRRCRPDGSLLFPSLTDEQDSRQLMFISELWRVEPETGEADSAKR